MPCRSTGSRSGPTSWWSATVPSRWCWPNAKRRIGERTLAQAVRYNSVLGARFVILTNGLRHYCCEYRDGKYVQLSGIPDFSAL